MIIRPTVVILGGGYTGAATAIDLSRNSTAPLDIVVVEPRDQVGRGVAYSAKHPDHRLNGATGFQNMIPEEPDNIDNWFRDTIGFENDPEAEAFDGSIFVRRWDFGSYVNSVFERFRTQNPSNSTIRHVQDVAVDVQQTDEKFQVSLQTGTPLTADAVIITTSNGPPTLPFPFSGVFDNHPAMLSNPWDIAAIQAIPPDARGLVIGTGLTAADVVAVLARQNHRGRVISMSRRGLRPTSRPRSHAAFPNPFWDRVTRSPSLFTEKHGRLRTALGVLRAIRADVAKVEQQGLPWQVAFDDLRDSLRDIWIHLPFDEKRRALRHLNPFYDIHRFRYPPQTEAQLLAAEDAGMLDRRRGHLLAATKNGQRIDVEWQDRDHGVRLNETFDFVVSCVGPEMRPEKTGNPILQALMNRGLARPSPLGKGLDVDTECRAIAKDGAAMKNLFVLGPLTFTTFAYSIGAPFIMAQIREALPYIFADLGLDPTP